MPIQYRIHVELRRVIATAHGKLTSAEMDAASGSRFAIVAPDDFAFGLGRMYATYREMDRRSRKEARVFRSMERALAWLDEARGAE